MNTHANSHLSLGTLRRISAEAISHHAAAPGQAARLAGLGASGPSRAEPPASWWDGALLDRLTTPLSRIRE